MEVSEVEGKGLVYVDVGKRLAAKVTLEAIEELRLKVGESVTCLIKTNSVRIGPEVE
jgi:molybdopterin-binding protein